MKRINITAMILSLLLLLASCTENGGNGESDISYHSNSSYSMDTLEAVKEQLTEHSDELGIVNIDIRKYNSKEKVIVEVMNKSAEVIVKAEDIVGRDLCNNLCVFYQCEPVYEEPTVDPSITSGAIYENAEISSVGRNSEFLPLYLFAIYQRTDASTYRGLIKTQEELLSFLDEMDKAMTSSEFVSSSEPIIYNIRFEPGEGYYEDYKEKEKEFIKKYDEEYFENHALLIAQFIGYYESGDLYSIKNISVDENNKLSITIKEASGFGTFGSGSHVLTADINKSEIGNIDNIEGILLDVSNK